MSVKTSAYMDNFNYCRCCLNCEGLSDLAEEFRFNSSEKEVYDSTLRNTFNIDMNTYSFIGKKICNLCMVKLKDAALFRRQVLKAEAVLARHEELQITGCKSPKQETHSGSDNENDSQYECNDVENNMEIVSFEKEIIIKIEPKDDKEIPKTKRKKNSNRTVNAKKLIKSELNNKNEGVEVRRRHKNKDPDENLNERIFNTIQLITNSNMMVFVSKKTKFACHYCKQSYLEITMLRQHYEEKKHPMKTFIHHLKMCKGLSYKSVDISNLNCNICTQPCEDLKDLQTHLAIHGLVFKSEHNLLVPYKLEQGNICVLCKAEFKTYCRLSIHMNKHSNCNVCEICGEAYINRISLRNHISRVHKEKNCSICAAVFPNTSAKVKHMRVVHKTFTKRYCLKCELTFQYDYQLSKHMSESHGVKCEIVKCEQCSKIFTPVNLRTHIRAVHIGERNHPCTLCQMRFFTSHDRKRHERSHRDEKLFACEFCEVKFKTKDSMRRHVKSQHIGKINS